jgi:hypothetical protein
MVLLLAFSFGQTGHVDACAYQHGSLGCARIVYLGHRKLLQLQAFQGFLLDCAV